MLDRKTIRSLIVALALSTISFAARAQFAGLNTFDGWWDGSNPYYADYLAQDINGNIHGTMPAGGGSLVPYGSWFDYPVGGTVTINGLTSPTGPQTPTSGLTLGIDGNLYGASGKGGATTGNGSTYGTVFKIVNGQISTVYPFTGGANGGYPWAPPIQAPDGNLYGVTWESYLVGYVYQIVMSNGVGTLGWIHPLPAGSVAALIMASDGNMYGTTSYGGLPINGVAQNNNNGGALFQVTLGGVITGIFNFDATSNLINEIRPYGGVIQGADGYLYGTTSEGGAYAGGTLYRVALNGSNFSVIHHFQFNDGTVPTGGLMQGSDGYIYGLTSANGYIQQIVLKGGGPLFNVGGTIFKTDTTGANFQRLFTFYGSKISPYEGSGLYPYATPLLHTSGTIYGLTMDGGSGPAPSGSGPCHGCYANGGEFFSYGTGMAPFVSVVNQRNAKVGDRISIIGQGFYNWTGVTFGGTAVTSKFAVQVWSDNFMTVAVPSGAKTGKIVVQELGGADLSTPYNFTITCSGLLCLRLP